MRFQDDFQHEAAGSRELLAFASKRFCSVRFPCWILIIPRGFFSIFNSHARRGLFFRWCFYIILDVFLWNHAVSLVLLVSWYVFLCFKTISSRNVAVANGFSSTHHSYTEWRSFSRSFFHRFGHRFQQSFFRWNFISIFDLIKKASETALKSIRNWKTEVCWVEIRATRDR